MLRKIFLVAAVVFSTAAFAQSGTAAMSQDSGAVGAVGGKLPRSVRFDRGLAFDTKTPTMPKGMWVVGINGSVSSHAGENFDAFILSDLNSKGNGVSVSPMVHYVFDNNQSVGVRFQYRHRLLDMTDLDLHLTDELWSMLFGEDGKLKYKYQSDSYMGFLSYRYYIGMGTSKRLVLFNELQLGLGGGTQREDSGATDAGTFKRSTFQRSFDLRAGISPGATMFITNNAALEMQIGLIGYEFSRLTQETTFAAETPGQIGLGPEKGSRETHNVSAKFDFFSVAFGVTFYL